MIKNTLASIILVIMVFTVFMLFNFLIYGMIALGFGIPIILLAKRRDSKLTFPINVRIVEEREGGGLSESYDRAGYYVKEGQEYYRLKTRKHLIKAPDFDKIRKQAKGMMITLYSAKRGSYTPMVFSKGTYEPLDEDMKFWAVAEYKAAYYRFFSHTWLEKYGFIIAVVFFALAVAIVLWATGDYMQKVVTNLAAITGQLGQIASDLAASTAPVQQVATPPF